MKNLLLVFALVCSLQSAVAASDDWTDIAAQSLYKSAELKRNGAWTKEISSLKDLKETLKYYVKWLNQADSLDNPSHSDSEWVSHLIDHLNHHKLDSSSGPPMKLAMYWRERLVGFAGEDSVATLDKGVPRESFAARYTPFDPANVGYIRGDFGSGQLQYVPGQGLEKD